MLQGGWRRGRGRSVNVGRVRKKGVFLHRRPRSLAVGGIDTTGALLIIVELVGRYIFLWWLIQKCFHIVQDMGAELYGGYSKVSNPCSILSGQQGCTWMLGIWSTRPAVRAKG